MTVKLKVNLGKSKATFSRIELEVAEEMIWNKVDTNTVESQSMVY